MNNIIIQIPVKPFDLDEDIERKRFSYNYTFYENNTIDKFSFNKHIGIIVFFSRLF